MNQKTFLFFHAGPGLNCEAERQILGGTLKSQNIDVIFVDEPSNLRPRGPRFDPDRAATNLITAAENALLKVSGPVGVVGLSFGAIIAEHLASKFPEKISELLFISPTADLSSVFLKMMKLAESDFKKNNSAAADELKQIRLKVEAFFDLYCQQGLALTFQDPALFGHYWKNVQAMQRWAGTLSLPEYGMDTLSQQMVYTEMSQLDPFQKIHRSDIPAHILFGKFDPVMDHDITLKFYQNKFKKVKSTLFENSAHFPHLEESEKFLSLLK